MLPDPEIGEIPSAIYCSNRDTKSVSAITYGERCDLGVGNDMKIFSWLWRSRIRHFDRDSFYCRRWIVRIFEEHDWLDSEFLNKQAVFAIQEVKKLEEDRSPPPRCLSHSSDGAHSALPRPCPVNRLLTIVTYT